MYTGLCGRNTKESIHNRNSVLACGKKKSDNNGHLCGEIDSAESTREN